MKSLFLILSIFLVSACSTAPIERSINEKFVNEIRNSIVYVIIPQDKLQAMTFVAQVGGGGLLNQLESHSANKAMEDSLKPLYDNTRSLDFRSDFIKQLKLSKLFYKDKNIKIITKRPEYHQDRLELVKKANGRPVVIFEVSYALDYTYRTLLINTQAKLYTKLSENEIRIFNASYQSKPVHYDYSFYSADVAQKLWPKSNAEKYKKYYKQGINDTMTMLRTAILKRPSNLARPGENLPSFFNTTTNAMKVIQAKELSVLKDRSIVLSEDGIYHSKPTGPNFKTSSISRPKRKKHSARIYFYRTQGNDHAPVQPDILVSNVKIGKFVYGTYNYIDLKPGKHTIKLAFNDDIPGSTIAHSQIEDVKPVTLLVQKNKDYYVRFMGFKGIFTDDDSLKEIPEKIAKQEIRLLFSNYD